MIESIESRDAHLLKRDAVDLFDELVVCSRSLSVSVRNIEDRADLVCADDRVAGSSELGTS